jgi:dihydrofolate synthase/folylpolyglutamate synthase
MADFATSDNPLVQRQLERLASLSPGGDVLGLERVSALLERLGSPERSLPPVFHVAGTNGKGSTCAFLRAAIEAEGLSAHVFTSPHLVRFNERIRLSGKLIEDEHLAALLEEVLDASKGISPTFFEVTTAAALLGFSRTPADACIIEVGLGGRLDATNVIPSPAVCGIAQLGLDHQAFLGSRLEDIAAEKAGIAKPGVPLVTQLYPDRDEAGKFDLPLPRLKGAHQAGNAGLAIAMLRHQKAIEIGEPAMRAAMGWTEWPARLQKLSPGPLQALLPSGAELWLDGGHNPAAARAIADFFRAYVPAGRPFHIIFGLLENKDAAGVLKPFRGRAITLHSIPIPGHAHHSPSTLAGTAEEAGLKAVPANDVEDALRWIQRHADRAQPPIVLIMGSLYLAGEVLRKNGQAPS